MNDEQILEAGGTEDDIKKYAEQNGANLSELDVLIESGIAEFDKEFNNLTQTMPPPYPPLFRNPAVLIKAFLTSFATKAHNNALESALEALPKEIKTGARDLLLQKRVITDVNIPTHEVAEMSYFYGEEGHNKCLEEARTKVSALKKEI